MSRKILIADNEEGTLDLVSATLENDGTVETLTAKDGEEALDLARQWGPELIFLDAFMPRRNGYQVCQALKGDPATADIRIVMLGLCQEFDRRKALLDFGADEYISKPFNPVALFQTFQTILTNR